MSDRTSAGIFGDIFIYLAKDPTPAAVAFARRMWAQSGEYDFSPYQMGADDALITLGLAHMGIDPQYPDEEVVVYDL